MTGQTISHYTILEELGEGGMGVVYKARDNRLERPVAIKVLSPARAGDAERKRRFAQEARAASALNHPNIVTIHDIDEVDGIEFIAMEYIQGKTLEHCIPRQGMRLNEALKAAIQIAGALAAAHGAGIVHRDLKPGNIMVTEQGLVKVLDFGLAKLGDSGIHGDDKTTSTLRPLTEEGAILGTVAYMSPEQAEGKAVDPRSDIFSFGSVLYEMITGQKAFRGRSKVSTIAAILREEPRPAGQLVEEVPADLEKLLKRCLRKDPARRIQHMGEVRIALEELKEESDADGQPAPLPERPWHTRTPLWAGALAAIVAILAAAIWVQWRGAGTSTGPLRVIPLTAEAGIEGAPSFSPDENSVAFHWNGGNQDNFDIYVKQTGSEGLRRLTTDPAPDFSPSWSPDGREIAFFRQLDSDRMAVLLVPAAGGRERSLGEIQGFRSPDVMTWTLENSIAWSPDGKWLALSSRDSPRDPLSLRLLSAAAGERRRLTSPPASSRGDIDPAFSPDGRSLVFTRTAADFGVRDLYLLRLNRKYEAEGEPRRLTFENRWTARPVWIPGSGEILYCSGAAWLEARLWKTGIGGSERPHPQTFAGEGVMQAAVSRTGRRLVYTSYSVDTNIWRVQVDRSGESSPPALFIASTRRDSNPQFSPDGKRIAFASNRSGGMEIWICGRDGSNALQVTTLGGPNTGSPRWSPDGKRIAFDSMLAGSWDIYTVPVEGGKLDRLTTDPARDVSPSWSHDGRWIYFGSDRSGENQVWKVPAQGGEAIPVTSDGGYVAFESPDGKSLYYTKSPDGLSGLWRMPVRGGREEKVAQTVHAQAFAPAARGVYFIPSPGPGGQTAILFLSRPGGEIRTVARLHKPLRLGLAVSPDEGTILYSQFDQLGSDLMLVENFR